MALETGELKEASPPADSIYKTESGVEADADYSLPSSSSPLLSMREIKYIREDSQLSDRSTYSGQSQSILSFLSTETSASEHRSPSIQEGKCILPLYDVTLNMGQICSYYCDMCNYGGPFATWFEVLSHARTLHGGNPFKGARTLMLANLLNYPSSIDNGAASELSFTLLALFQALEDQLIPTNFPQLMYDLYYSKTCPFSECLATSGSPEVNRYSPSNPSMLEYSLTLARQGTHSKTLFLLLSRRRGDTLFED